MFSSSPSESDSSPAEMLRYGELSEPSRLLCDPLLGCELSPSSSRSQSFLMGTQAEFSGILAKQIQPFFDRALPKLEWLYITAENCKTST